jgi:hypothetical protein
VVFVKVKAVPALAISPTTTVLVVSYCEPFAELRWDDIGYGSCGTIIDDNANSIALPHGLMGAQSNGNPYCGRTVSIKGTDGSIHQATVADKCGGCDSYAIDLTPVLFNAVAPAGDGRVHGIQWWFN